jgi:AcrR family transcriptional regulator
MMLPADTASRGGRPRSEEVDRAIVDATLDLLVSAGVAGISIEQVASQAGVGKATIYRRWPNKEALIIDAAMSIRLPLPELNGESVRDDLLKLAENLRLDKASQRTRGVYDCLVREAPRHSELAARFEQVVVEPRREAVRHVLRRGVASGELRDDVDIETMALFVTAPILVHSLRHGRPALTQEDVRQIVDMAMLAIRRPEVT